MTKKLKTIFLKFVDIGTFRGYIYNKRKVVETLKFGRFIRKNICYFNEIGPFTLLKEK